MTRSFVSGIPVVPERVTLAMCGTWVADHIVYSSVARTGCTSTLRGSIAFGISRCWRYCSLTVTAASEKSLSTSPFCSGHV